MISLLLIISQLTHAFDNCQFRETDYNDTHDFITHKIRNTNCYDAHNPPRMNGTTRIAVSLFIADMDSISEQTMGRDLTLIRISDLKQKLHFSFIK